MLRSMAIATLTQDLHQLKRMGAPGGRGGSSDSQGVAQGIDKLGQHAPVFELRYADGQVLVRDLLGGKEGNTDGAWKPHNYAFNGLSLRIWGGYVSILSMNYGGGSSSQGARGGDGLGDLSIDLLPLPATGSLVVAKNGAVSYRLDH